MKSRDLKNLLNSAAAALEDLHADLSDRDKVCLIEDLRAEADEIPECYDRHILIYGNPVDGLRFAGPFGDTDEAQEHAEVDKIEEWWIANLEPPLKKEPAGIVRLQGDEGEEEVELEEEDEKPRVNGGVFKSIIGNGDSTDREIDSFQAALDLADNLLPGGDITQKFEEGLYEILVENGYPTEEEED